MASATIGFDEFIATVDGKDVDFISEMHKMLTDAGCKIEIKYAKSGYVVSYLLNKKTIANYVFRKKGILIRIYANHIGGYFDLLEALPESAAKGILAAPDCKRLINPSACNAKCAMGYEFLLRGERLQKCRYNAFLLLICDENNPYIKEFLQRELEACA